MDTLDFIKQVAAGKATEAKETLSSIIDNLAFESIDAMKKTVARGVFGEGKLDDLEDARREREEKKKDNYEYDDEDDEDEKPKASVRVHKAKEND